MPTQDAQSRMRRLAERQWGVVSRAQLTELGFSRDEVLEMRRREHLLDLFRGVYAVGHRRMTMRGRLHAAQLAAGPGAFLSHRTAAAHRGLCRHPVSIVLTIPSDHSPGANRGLHVHRTTIPIDHSQARLDDGLLVATVPRIITDLACTERAGEIQRLMRESIRTGQFDLPAVAAAIDAHPRRPGTGLARAALCRYLPGTEDRRSWLETSFHAHERADQRLPTPLYNERRLGYEIDVLWDGPRVTLELDGRPYHVAVEDFDRDRTKDRTLLRHGWRPVRVSDLEWEHDRAHVLEDLYAVLGV